LNTPRPNDVEPALDDSRLPALQRIGLKPPA